MKLIVGLGNPGKQYDTTRHNAGWLVLDELAVRLNGTWHHDDHLEADVCEVALAEVAGGQKVLLAKPTTLMNNSGRSIERIRAYYKVDPADIVVVHDELALPLGTVRTRLGGQTAGHNGVGSAIHHLGTEAFWRIRVGIETDHPQRTADPTGFVLDRFSAEERTVLDVVVDRTVTYLVQSLTSGTIEDTTFTVVE